MLRITVLESDVIIDSHIDAYTKAKPLTLATRVRDFAVFVCVEPAHVLDIPVFFSFRDLTHCLSTSVALAEYASAEHTRTALTMAYRGPGKPYTPCVLVIVNVQ